MHDFSHEMEILKEEIKTIFEEIYALKLPTFKIIHLDLHRLDMVVKAMQHNFGKMKDNAFMSLLWDLIFYRLKSFGWKVRSKVLLYAREIPAKVNVLTETLRKYKDSLKIDKDFLV